MDIITLLQSVNHLHSQKVWRQLIVIAEGMLAMTGRVTMLGISRWTEAGGSYRTIQRFFAEAILWPKINLHLFLSHRYGLEDEVAMIICEKAGKKTHGPTFFHRARVVKGLEFFSLSLINGTRRESSPMLMKQTIRSKQEKKGRKSAKKSDATTKKKRGRPKGSKNKNHREIQLPPHLQLIQTYVESVLSLIGQNLVVKYLLLDGAFGNNNALQMSLRCGLHLISKLRSDAALFFPYDGEQKKRGPRRKYGKKVSFTQIDATYLVKTIIDKKIETRIYGFEAWSKSFPDLLNVTVIVRINHQNGKVGHAVLFSSDLDLKTDRLVDWYTLRFQIEFNFRDAKQFWGLEDFMNVNETQVKNAANLAMFMVNLSHILAANLSPNEKRFSILDLKATYRGRKYVWEVLKYLPKPPDRFLINQLLANVGLLGSINCPSSL